MPFKLKLKGNEWQIQSPSHTGHISSAWKSPVTRIQNILSSQVIRWMAHSPQLESGQISWKPSTWVPSPLGPSVPLLTGDSSTSTLCEREGEPAGPVVAPTLTVLASERQAVTPSHSSLGLLHLPLRPCQRSNQTETSPLCIPSLYSFCKQDFHRRPAPTLQP